MTRKPAAPNNLRNGLKWRDGRPRWEPSPANRACGFPGVDLRDHAGAWMDRGAATTAADARTLWAGIVREAMRDTDAGGKARVHLRMALDLLPPLPAEAEGRRKRELIADLIERGRAVLEEREPGVTEALTHAPRTVNALVEAFFADRAAMSEIKASSQRAYRTCSRKIAAEFGGKRVDEITKGQLKAWHGRLSADVSVATANLTMGAFGAMLAWATLQDPPWLAATPIQRLKLPRAKGRRVFWTVEEEKGFIAWCDANGYADVADAVTACLWTGARQIDVCKATLADLSGQTWRYVPTKTERKDQVALPGILPAVSARVQRRLIEAARSHVKHIGGSAPFLWNPEGRRHTSQSIGDRFREARAWAVKAKAVPETFAGKTLQDTRDTCVTRLYAAEVTLARIGSWGGWSNPEKILREHYLSLLDEGAIEDGGKLLLWAREQGLGWAAA
ncbi:MAG: tyrosine-type recombinase/integrase [Brevundimonas sp.]|uniref:tyrosine-type recombinase/integrase n=1 Tax=Brevundimonas sp. TaxID=1871086 RepID=UPI004033F9AF